MLAQLMGNLRNILKLRVAEEGFDYLVRRALLKIFIKLNFPIEFPLKVIEKKLIELTHRAKARVT